MTAIISPIFLPIIFADYFPLFCLYFIDYQSDFTYYKKFRMTFRKSWCKVIELKLNAVKCIKRAQDNKDNSNNTASVIIDLITLQIIFPRCYLIFLRINFPASSCILTHMYEIKSVKMVHSSFRTTSNDLPRREWEKITKNVLKLQTLQNAPTIHMGRIICAKNISYGKLGEMRNILIMSKSQIYEVKWPCYNTTLYKYGIISV